MPKILNIVDKLIEFARKFPILNKFPVNFYRFVFVGCTSFLIDFIIFRFLFDLLNLELRFFDLISAANVISVACATVYGYILNKRWSFEDKADNVATQFSKYALVAILNNSLNNVFFGLFFYKIFQETFIFNKVVTSSISKMLATSFQTVTSFVAYKYFVFPEEKEVMSETTVA
jgi:putative flippase GtrA